METTLLHSAWTAVLKLPSPSICDQKMSGCGAHLLISPKSLILMSLPHTLFLLLKKMVIGFFVFHFYIGETYGFCTTAKKMEPRKSFDAKFWRWRRRLGREIFFPSSLPPLFIFYYFYQQDGNKSSAASIPILKRCPTPGSLVLLWLQVTLIPSACHTKAMPQRGLS